MISVEHMDELITRFKSGELDIRDIIEQSYFGGRADAIEKVIKYIEAQFLTQNNSNSKFDETIVLYRDFVDELEQFKMQKGAENDKSSSC